MAARWTLLSCCLLLALSGCPSSETSERAGARPITADPGEVSPDGPTLDAGPRDTSAPADALAASDEGGSADPGLHPADVDGGGLDARDEGPQPVDTGPDVGPGPHPLTFEIRNDLQVPVFVDVSTPAYTLKLEGRESEVWEALGWYHDCGSCACEDCDQCAVCGAPEDRVRRLDPGRSTSIGWDGFVWESRSEPCPCVEPVAVEPGPLRATVCYAAGHTGSGPEPPEDNPVYFGARLAGERVCEAVGFEHPPAGGAVEIPLTRCPEGADCAVPVCCVEAADCGPGHQCEAGRCWPRGAPCTTAADCEEGEGDGPPPMGCSEDGHCYSLLCMCASDPDCPEEHRCVTTDHFCGACMHVMSTCVPRCNGSALYPYWLRLDPPPPGVYPDSPIEIGGRVRNATATGLEIEMDGPMVYSLTWELPPAPGGGEAYSVGVADGDIVVVNHFWGDKDSGGQWTALRRGGKLLLAASLGRPLPPEHQLGYAASVEDVGCANGQIGDCIQTRWAATAFVRSGVEPVFVFPGEEAVLLEPDTRDPHRLVGVGSVIDEDACRPPAQHGPWALYFLLPE